MRNVHCTVGHGRSFWAIECCTFLQPLHYFFKLHKPILSLPPNSSYDYACLPFVFSDFGMLLPASSISECRNKSCQPNTPPQLTHSSNAYPSTPSVTVNLYVLNTMLSYSSRPAALAFLCHGPNPPLNASSLLCQKPVLTVSYSVTISTPRVAVRKAT
jgi:hypothetical protein